MRFEIRAGTLVRSVGQEIICVMLSYSSNRSTESQLFVAANRRTRDQVFCLLLSSTARFALPGHVTREAQRKVTVPLDFSDASAFRFTAPPPPHHRNPILIVSHSLPFPLAPRSPPVVALANGVAMQLPILLLLFSPLLCHASHASSFPHGKIHPLLHSQALSHLAFHSSSLKLSLASLFGAPPSASPVAVVGVEWGSEVFPLASAGFSVYALEPASKFVAHLRDQLREHPEWNVTVLPLAAGKERGGSMTLEYGNEDVREEVERGIVDDYVKEGLAVMSIDIQGDELDVLEGSEELMRERGVSSLWIEGIACNDKVAGVLDLLDDRYVLFDFVPWGKPKDDSEDGVPRSLESFAFDPERPGCFKDFLDWMCREKEQRYQWLQTDFLAVRRDLLTDQGEKRLAALAKDHCVKDGSNCRLRSLLHDTENDEL